MFELLWRVLIYPRSSLRPQHELAMEVLALRHLRNRPTAPNALKGWMAFLRNPDKVEAISTNSDIYVTPLDGGPAKNITASNRGYDVGPVYTRDGKYILYRSQAAPGFEADGRELCTRHLQLAWQAQGAA